LPRDLWIIGANPNFNPDNRCEIVSTGVKYN
jgi:hypothetical protein